MKLKEIMKNFKFRRKRNKNKQFTVTDFSFSKNGNFEDSQDAVYYSKNDISVTFSICDGVSQSFLPGVFSKKLAYHTLINHPVSKINATVVHSASKEYMKELKSEIRKWEEKYSEGIPSYMLKRLSDRDFASSTIIHGKVDFDENEIEVQYVGDCNLFIFNSHGEMIKSFPYKSISNFPSAPNTIKAFSENIDPCISIAKIDIPVENGMIFIATDALSRYILQYVKNSFHESILSLTDTKKLRTRIEKLWNESTLLENDDISFLRITF